jgi:hypothetical protein
LQVLDTEQLEYAFQQQGISHESLARRFYSDVWALIQAAEKIRDDTLLAQCGADLRNLCQAYFAKMREWSHEEEERYENVPFCKASLDNMREARAGIPAFERQFYRYALCYMELNRALIHARVKIAPYAKDYHTAEFLEHLKVNHGTGVLLQQAHRERRETMEKRLRMERVRSILKQFDPLLETLGAELPGMFDADGDRALTQFKAALRKEDFDRALKLSSSWRREKLQKIGKTLITLTRQHCKELRAADGLLLHSGELTLVESFLKGDEARINEFVTKYNVPYMVFQYQNLLRQGYLLGRIGSLEGLIIHHAKLLALSCRPHDDPAQAQAQEQGILIPARFLLKEKFKTLSAIFDEMETTMSILEKLVIQTREYQNSLPGC